MNCGAEGGVGIRSPAYESGGQGNASAPPAFCGCSDRIPAAGMVRRTYQTPALSHCHPLQPSEGSDERGQARGGPRRERPGERGQARGARREGPGDARRTVWELELFSETGLPQPGMVGHLQWGAGAALLLHRAVADRGGVSLGAAAARRGGGPVHAGTGRERDGGGQLRWVCARTSAGLSSGSPHTTNPSRSYAPRSAAVSNATPRTGQQSCGALLIRSLLSIWGNLKILATLEGGAAEDSDGAGGPRRPAAAGQVRSRTRGRRSARPAGRPARPGARGCTKSAAVRRWWESARLREQSTPRCSKGRRRGGGRRQKRTRRWRSSRASPTAGCWRRSPPPHQSTPTDPWCRGQQPPAPPSRSCSPFVFGPGLSPAELQSVPAR